MPGSLTGQPARVELREEATRASVLFTVVPQIMGKDSPEMAVQLVRLLAIILVVRGSVMAGSEETLQRVKREHDNKNDDRESSASKCPCTQGCCEHGWFQYRDACYKAVFQQKTWNHAEEHCVTQEEAHLASIHSLEEDNFILHLMGNDKFKPYWLGAKRIRQGEELHWMWTDQSPFLYKPVQKRYSPKEHDNNLAAWSVDNQGHIVWWYQDGTKSHPFICKYILA